MIYFDGQLLSNASTYEDDAGVITKESTTLTGKKRVSTSHETSFKVSFSCYTEDLSEITVLKNKIGEFKTLVIDGVSYETCAINLFKHKQYAPGKYYYEIGFSHDSGAALSNKVYASEETVHVYTDYTLDAGEELDSIPILLRGLAYVNISVENKGSSEDLEIKLYGSYDQVGTSKYPMFLSTLDNTPEGKTSGGTIAGPPNYGFLHVKNADTTHSTTFDFTVSKVATL